MKKENKSKEETKNSDKKNYNRLEPIILKKGYQPINEPEGAGENPPTFISSVAPPVRQSSDDNSTSENSKNTPNE